MNKKSTWIFLRGLVRGQDHWDGFEEYFQERLPQTIPLLLDIPGNGRLFDKRSPSSIKKMVEQIRHEALPYINNNTYIFSISLGSMVALQWMHDYPKEIQGAVLINTSSKNSGQFHERLRVQNYRKILGLVGTSNGQEKEKKILSMTSANTKEHPRIARLWGKLHKTQPVSTFNAARQIYAASRFQHPEEAPPGKFLFLASEGDQFVDWHCSERIAKDWKKTFILHSSAGHDLPLDDRKWILDQIEKHLPFEHQT